MFEIFADQKPLYTPGNPYRVVTNPKIVVELGKAGSLTCGLPPGNDLYGELNKLRTKIECVWDEERIFSGRLLSEEKDFWNIRTLYCEGDLSYLVDSVQKMEAYKGTTHKLYKKIIDKHNERVDEGKRFKIGRIQIEDREIIITGQSEDEGDGDEIDYKQIAINSITNEWGTTLDVIQTCLIDYCGGYLKTRKEEDGLYLDILTDEGDAIEQEIEFGVNLLEMTEEVTAEELFTVLIPLGDDNLTIGSVNNGSDELVDDEAVAEYGRIVRTHVFDNVNKASTLLENGQRYMRNRHHIPKIYTISTVDLHLLNPDIRPIHIGDRVMIKSTPHGIREIMMCTRIEYDLENAENTLYTFGNPKQTLTERYRRDKRRTQENITNSAGGGSGGASKKAKQEATDYVYKEWIDFDPDNPDGHISLGGLIEQYQNAIKVLENQVGIDMSAASGNVNIRALRKQYDDLGTEIQSQRAQIDLLVKETNSQIESVVTYIGEQIDGTIAEQFAALTLYADSLGSRITAVADDIKLHAKKIVTISGDLLKVESELASFKAIATTDLEAIRTDISMGKFNVVSAKVLLASGHIRASGVLYADGGMQLKGQNVKTTSLTIVTGITQASGHTAPVTSDYTILTV